MLCEIASGVFDPAGQPQFPPAHWPSRHEAVASLLSQQDLDQRTSGISSLTSHRTAPRSTAPWLAVPIDSFRRLGEHSRVAPRKPLDKQQHGDEAALLIAALDHAWTWYNVRIDRGLQVVNYFLVAVAVLATAYVSALNGKHNAVAAAIALSAAVLTGVAFTIGYTERREAVAGEVALAELQKLLAEKLEIDSIRMIGPRPGAWPHLLAARIAFGLAVTLSVGSALYALVH
jgi:hypothetical protein